MHINFIHIVVSYYFPVNMHIAVILVCIYDNSQNNSLLLYPRVIHDVNYSQFNFDKVLLCPAAKLLEAKRFIDPSLHKRLDAY